MEESRINSEKIFEHDNELQEKMKRQAELNELLEVDKNEEVLMDGDEKEEVIAKEEAVEIIKQVMDLQELGNVSDYEMER